MIITSIFAGAFLSVIIGKSLDEAKNRFVGKPATKIFEDSVKKLEKRRLLRTWK